jgi:AcrR family transcriptional regulator
MRDRGQATRDRLLDAAVQLITEVGWGAVTTRKIADRAGVPFGVVHYHFSSVPDLLIDAAVLSSRAAIDEAIDALVSAPDVTTGIERMLATLDATDAEDPSTLLLAEAFLAATREERLRGQLGELLDGFRRTVSAWLQANGTPDPEPTAAVVAAVLDGLVLHRALDRSRCASDLIGPLRRLTTGKG